MFSDKSEDASEVATCVRCTKFASHVCQTCGDFYCSPTCQRLDWRSHRYICRKMPKLVMKEVFDNEIMAVGHPLQEVRGWLENNCAEDEGSANHSFKFEQSSQTLKQIPNIDKSGHASFGIKQGCNVGLFNGSDALQRGLEGLQLHNTEGQYSKIGKKQFNHDGQQCNDAKNRLSQHQFRRESDEQIGEQIGNNEPYRQTNDVQKWINQGGQQHHNSDSAEKRNQQHGNSGNKGSQNYDAYEPQYKQSGPNDRDNRSSGSLEDRNGNQQQGKQQRDPQQRQRNNDQDGQKPRNNNGQQQRNNNGQQQQRNFNGQQHQRNNNGQQQQRNNDYQQQQRNLNDQQQRNNNGQQSRSNDGQQHQRNFNGQQSRNNDGQQQHIQRYNSGQQQRNNGVQQQQQQRNNYGQQLRNNNGQQQQRNYNGQQDQNKIVDQVLNADSQESTNNRRSGNEGRQWCNHKSQHDMPQQNRIDSRNMSNSNNPERSNANQNQNQQNYSKKRQSNYQSYQSNQERNDDSQQERQSSKNERQGQNIDQSTIAPVLQPPFEITKLDENDTNFLLRVIDTSSIKEGLFACIPDIDYTSFIEMQIFLTKMDKGGQPYKPVLNEYCIALFEEEWYRAKVIGAYGNEFKVEYIDFTNQGFVKTEDIRRYPLGLTNVNSTSLCKLAGLPDKLGSKLLNQLEEMIVDFQKLYVQTVKKFDKFYEIECPVLLKQLSELGFI